MLRSAADGRAACAVQVWFETSEPSMEQAEQFAAAIHAK
jgi:isocitrate lyase